MSRAILTRIIPPDIALTKMHLDKSIRAELEVTCSTHPDNPFPVYNEVTTRTDSRHFNSSAERCLVEDVAGVSGNRCIKHGSSSTLVDWQTTVGIFFKTRISAKISSVSSVARNKRHARRVPSDVGNEQSEFGGDTMRRSGDTRSA